MSTPLHYRLGLSFTTCTALHPGSGETRDVSDAPVTVDGTGDPILRSSAVIGSIRHDLARPGLFDVAELRRILGDIGTEDGPSLVSADDAPISDAVFEVRQGVGIDRVTGAAANQIKYDVSVIARGAHFTVVLHADIDASAASLIDEFFATVASRAQRGLLRFGARSTRGFGALQLDSTEFSIVDDRADFVIATLALARDIWPSTTLPNAVRHSTVPVFRFTVDWRIASAMFSKSALSANMAIPQTGVIVDRSGVAAVSLLLAGSSAKGVLRSTGEYQVRTLLELDPTPTAALNDQINVPGIADLFGWAADDDHDSGHVAAVSVDDCYGQTRIATADWTTVEHCAVDTGSTDTGGSWSTMRTVLDQAGLNVWRTMVHNRINEVTGGVVKGFLFSTLVPLHEHYEPLEITVDLGRIPEDIRDALLGLVLSILREVRRGTVAFGFGTTKGFGQLNPGSPVSVTLIDGDPPDGFPDDGTPFDPFNETSAGWRTQLGRALSIWYGTRTREDAA